ncbi:MAG: DUF3089 domain-containing protein [Blastomonas sp.]
MARKFLYLIVIIIVLIIGALTAMKLFPMELSRMVYVPKAEFVEQEVVEPGIYADKAMWFARPEITDGNPALWTPKGFEPDSSGPVAVFYVHPTSYLANDFWNAPLDDEESQDRAKIFIRSQASTFNAVGPVWAPRYRQAAFGAFLTDKPEGQMALDAAYSDVLAAFDEFIRELPENTPFILAGHSQGALHLTHLLKNRIAGQPLASRVVAAYVVGWPVSKQTDLAAMGLPACEKGDQPGCVLSWQSFAEPAEPEMILSVFDASTGFDGQSRKDSIMVCTNPVTGVEREETAADQNIGTLVPNDDLTDGEIVAGAVPAKCDARGFLLIGAPPDLGKYVLPGNNYHVYDYPLFWADVRADAARRVKAFLAE